MVEYDILVSKYDVFSIFSPKKVKTESKKPFSDSLPVRKCFFTNTSSLAGEAEGNESECRHLEEIIVFPETNWNSFAPFFQNRFKGERLDLPYCQSPFSS